MKCGASSAYLRIKRAIDLVGSLFVLVAASPLFALLAWMIRRDSPGAALFRQVRAGRNARPFVLYKFRTMRTDVDPYGDSPQTGDDPRITRLGRWLRETSLDELPQFINVLRGDMSLVGPRPLYVEQIAEWSPRHRARLLMKPGLTGLAQINGRGSIPLEQKLEWDVQYIEAAGLRADLAILWRTLTGVFRREGIYEVQYSVDKKRRKEN